MRRVAALCGSFRRGSFNQSLLDAAIERSPEGLIIEQLDITGFPFFSQDLESPPPADVTRAKQEIQRAHCVLLVSPEYDYGVPGYLKNAVDWLSRPHGDPTLSGRPMALMGASSGHMGTIRGQLHWRQSWYFFRAPVFSEAELTVANSAHVFDEEGRLADEAYRGALDHYLATLLDWLERDCAPRG
jgi:chromate reductase